jgi:hypothetical protein
MVFPKIIRGVALVDVLQRGFQGLKRKGPQAAHTCLSKPSCPATSQAPSAPGTSNKKDILGWAREPRQKFPMDWFSQDAIPLLSPEHSGRVMSCSQDRLEHPMGWSAWLSFPHQDRKNNFPSTLLSSLSGLSYKRQINRRKANRSVMTHVPHLHMGDAKGKWFRFRSGLELQLRQHFQQKTI